MEQKSLGGYTILGELGRDTAGAVFRATDAQGDREVAIRTLPPTLPRDLRDRFLNEARAARRLKHANIVSVLEVGQHLDTAYIVMELIDGHALQQVMRASVRITLDRAAELAAQIADGLDCAHRVPIIHGNLKPANVPVEGGGRAKLTDFGVASLATPVTPKPVRPFQSPEQAGDQPLDARSDIFSLGVMLYAMLVRKAPFHRGLGEAHRPIREVDPNVPEAPEKIVDKALARNPDGHYLRATELAAELRKWRAHAKVTPTPSPLASVDILVSSTRFPKNSMPKYKSTHGNSRAKPLPTRRHGASPRRPRRRLHRLRPPPPHRPRHRPLRNLQRWLLRQRPHNLRQNPMHRLRLNLRLDLLLDLRLHRSLNRQRHPLREPSHNLQHHSR